MLAEREREGGGERWKMGPAVISLELAQTADAALLCFDVGDGIRNLLVGVGHMSRPPT